jgi:hypothetical protein
MPHNPKLDVTSEIAGLMASWLPAALSGAAIYHVAHSWQLAAVAAYLVFRFETLVKNTGGARKF